MTIASGAAVGLSPWAASEPRTPRRFQRRSGRLMLPNATPSCQRPQ